MVALERSAVVELMQSIFTSAEASAYLGITTQRLNQLVSNGSIKPIKVTKGVKLFYKLDLDERKKEVNHIGKDLDGIGASLDLESSFLNEVINYYTIHSFFNNSDKKTVPIFEGLSKEIDVQENIDRIYNDVAKLLSLDVMEVLNRSRFVRRAFAKLEQNDYIIKRGMPEYPTLLDQTNDAPPYLFMRGNISLLKEKIVSVVGSRMASEDGRRRAAQLAKRLGQANIVVASGLARGIDAAAQSTCIQQGYNTISVIGTPITKVYPKEHAALQEAISKRGLVVSQFAPSTSVQRWHFPMRNAVMSGISLSTIVVEAGETSGSLKQADYALKQGRVVFIPHSAVMNDRITWPKRYLKRPGVHEFRDINEVFDILLNTEMMKGESTGKNVNGMVSMNLFGDDFHANAKN